jgi:hypothetical protein
MAMRSFFNTRMGHLRANGGKHKFAVWSNTFYLKKINLKILINGQEGEGKAKSIGWSEQRLHNQSP